MLEIAPPEFQHSSRRHPNGKRLTYRRLTKPLDTKNRRLF